MTSCAIFEDFGTETAASGQLAEAEPVEVTLAKVRGRARADGFADGVASVCTEQEAECASLLRAISERFVDAQIARFDHDNRAIELISNAVTSIVEAIAPDIGHPRLVLEISSALRGVIDEQLNQRPTIFVEPARLEEMQALLDSASVEVEVRGDPALAQLQARVDWKTGFELVDVASLVSRATDVLRQHLGTETTDCLTMMERRYANE